MERMMKSVNNLIKLAERFAYKLSQAQLTSAQPDDIRVVLEKAGMWEKSAEVAPMLNTAGVADDATVSIDFTVDKGLNIHFRVATTPPAAAAKLTALVKAKYGNAMKAALQAAKVTVADTVDVNWLRF
jgi:hypothetical protein